MHIGVNHDAIYCALFPCTCSASQAFHPNSFIARFRCVLIDSRHSSTTASILVSGVLCWIKIMKFIAQLILVVIVVVALGPSFILLLVFLWLLVYLAGWHK